MRFDGGDPRRPTKTITHKDDYEFGKRCSRIVP